jgi:Zn-dependent M32 family carboxypeptidase
MAWALFEIQVHRNPNVDPDRLWSDITSEYLGIVPHPEWSWWAMRGQLINGPGYLVNYALGAFLTAHLRARAAERAHSFSAGGPGLYPWLGAELYRFGLERPSRRVLEQFLGGPVRPDPLLADLRRMAGGRTGAHR